MARTIPANYVTEMNKAESTEPLVVVKVDWASGSTVHADQALSFLGFSTLGDLQNFAPVASQSRLTNLGEIASAGVTLMDTSGFLKQKVDRDILEGTTATVFHYYRGLSETDAIVLLKGTITAPINWSEGSRLLTFNIDSEILDNEIGHAPVAGAFTDLHDDAVGVPWPLCFGTVLKVPAIHVIKIIRGELAETIIHDQATINIKNGEDFVQGSSTQVVIGNVLCTGTFSGSVFTPTSMNDAFVTNLALIARPAGDPDVNRADVAFVDATLPIPNLVGLYCKVVEATRGTLVNKCVKQEGNKTWWLKSWRERGILDNDLLLDNTAGGGAQIDEAAALPRGAWNMDFTYESQNFVTGVDRVTGRVFAHIVYLQPADLYTIFPPSSVRKFPFITTKYVCNLGSSTEILEVMAHRTLNGEDIFVPVPSSFYQVNLSETLDGQTVTTITFDRELIDRDREGWKNDIFVSLRSSKGSNTSTC